MANKFGASILPGGHNAQHSAKRGNCFYCKKKLGKKDYNAICRDCSQSRNPRRTP